jgi:HPt (histidine-containing phosphotransfer) domain-containing protein
MAGREAPAPVLDAGVLAELAASVGGDRGFVVDLIETYLADGEAQVRAIDAALHANDSAALIRPAHTLKSSSATLGAMRIAGAARALESSGRSGLPGQDAPEALAARLHDEWAEAVAALRAWSAGGEAR